MLLVLLSVSPPKGFRQLARLGHPVFSNLKLGKQELQLERDAIGRLAILGLVKAKAVDSSTKCRIEIKSL